MPSQGMSKCSSTETSTIVIRGFDKAMPSANPTVKIDHINAQSLLGHFDDIGMLIIERDLDILCISETWLHQDMSNAFINIPNFNVVIVEDRDAPSQRLSRKK